MRLSTLFRVLSAIALAFVIAGGRAAAQAQFNYAGAYRTGDGPRMAITVDLNDDGVPDLVTANTYSDSVSVLLSKGDGTFQPAVDYSAGSGPFCVAAGDLDGDGHVDIVTANLFGDSLTVLRGMGSGAFSAPVEYPAVAPAWVKLVDVDGDGVLDAVFAGYDFMGVVGVMRGRGDGTFADPAYYPAGTGSIALTIADFDHDGLADIAVANQDGGDVSILLGRADGSFVAGGSYFVDGMPLNVATADFNLDGYADLVVANAFGVVVLLGNGDGTFQPGFQLDGGDGLVSAADVDLDGKPDILLCDYSGGSLLMARGNGDGSFAPWSQIPIPAGAGPAYPAIGDLDGDGDPDLIVTGLDAGKVYLFTNAAATTPLLAGITALPDSIVGSQPFTITIILSRSVPYPVQVALTSSTAAAPVPDSVTIPSNAVSLSFQIVTRAVTTLSTGKITAKLKGVTRSASVTVTPICPAGLMISPGVVYGGQAAAASVRLDAPAAPGDIAVRITSSDYALAQPVDASGKPVSTLTIPAGAASASFLIHTSPVATSQHATIRTAANDRAQKATLQVNPAAISLSVDPANVTGGSRAVAVISLPFEAPAGGALVHLTSSNPSAAWFDGAGHAAATTATIPQGSFAASVSISTAERTTTASTKITASIPGSTKSVTLAILPSSVASRLQASSVTAMFSAVAMLKATLKSGASSLAGMTVRFSVNGVPAGEAVTNASGVAVAPYPVMLDLGAYPVTAEFAGQAPYAASSGAASLDVVVCATRTDADNAKARAGKSVAYGGKLTRLSDGAALSGRPLDFFDTATGEKVGTALTDSLGRAAITIIAPAKGVKRGITVMFGRELHYGGSVAWGFITGT